ncbi:MAG TPA: hypothetical protein VMU83_11700 [Hanamia sp.]|nr:hypothetical protein [Hanamia sp.]
MVSTTHMIKIFPGKLPVAINTPAVNNNPPPGIKKQKNNSVWQNTQRKTRSSPPYRISDSESNIITKIPQM